MFPRKRLVKACTKRFRGNATDVAAVVRRAPRLARRCRGGRPGGLEAGLHPAADVRRHRPGDRHHPHDLAARRGAAGRRAAPGPVPAPIFLGVSDSLWLAWAVAAAGGAILLAGCALTLRRRRRRGRGMLLGGFFPMVATGFFGAIALALTALNASGVSVGGPLPFPAAPPSPSWSAPPPSCYARTCSGRVWHPALAGQGAWAGHSHSSCTTQPIASPNAHSPVNSPMSRCTA
jgi:hypothetical protein